MRLLRRPGLYAASVSRARKLLHIALLLACAASSHAQGLADSAVLGIAQDDAHHPIANAVVTVQNLDSGSPRPRSSHQRPRRRYLRPAASCARKLRRHSRGARLPARHGNRSGGAARRGAGSPRNAAQRGPIDRHRNPAEAGRPRAHCRTRTATASPLPPASNPHTTAHHLMASPLSRASARSPPALAAIPHPIPKATPTPPSRPPARPTAWHADATPASPMSSRSRPCASST